MCHDEKRDINGNEPYHFLTKICTKYSAIPSIRDGVLCSGMLLYLHLILK